MTIGVPPLRAWLEPGYDGGRFGAWLLDFPGCFVWGRDRAVALARVPSAVAAFGWWLEQHGEAVAIPETDAVQVVEEVPATLDPEGVERNAVFAADRRSVEEAELTDILRRVDLARTDLLRVAERARPASEAIDLAGGSGEGGGEGGGRPDRSLDELLRHVAGSEIWLAGRLDRAARYEGASKDGDVDRFLDESHAWALDQVRALYRRDPALSAIDRHGEVWTLAKVLRRLLYHALDHLGELDRRVARAERSAERLVIRRDVLVDMHQLDALLRSVGWYRLVREPGRLARLLEGSTQIASAWDGDRMVGFARAMTDDAAYGLITTVAVHPGWQGKGVARRILLALLDDTEAIRWSLSSAPGAERLYASVGFVPDERAMVRRRTY